MNLLYGSKLHAGSINEHALQRADYNKKCASEINKQYMKGPFVSNKLIQLFEAAMWFKT